MVWYYDRPTGIMIMTMAIMASAIAITAAIVEEAPLHCGRVVDGTVVGADDVIPWNTEYTIRRATYQMALSHDDLKRNRRSETYRNADEVVIAQVCVVVVITERKRLLRD